MKDLKPIIKKIVEELLAEMTATGNVSGYSTPFAFSKSGKNKATAYIEKMGYKVCEDESENEKDEVLLEDVNYDSSKDITAFRKSLSAAEVSLSQKFSDSLKKKLLGKNIEVQASKGYGQFKTKYSLRVLDIKVEDWYGKEDYQLIITGEDRKQYFIDVTVPIKIVDSKGTPAVVPAADTNPTPEPVSQPKRPSTELDAAISK